MGFQRCQYESLHCVTEIFLISRKGHLEVLSDALLPVIQTIPASMAVEIRLFVTGTAEQNQLLFDGPLENSKAVVTIVQGRLDVGRFLKDEISGATGDLSVTGTSLCCLLLKSAHDDSSVWNRWACKERQNCSTRSPSHGYPQRWTECYTLC
jgi:hypothetical protein